MDVLDSIAASFSPNYTDARERFLAACGAHGVAARAWSNPNPGPAGEYLATDTAWFGPADWKEMVLWRSRQVQRQTLAALMRYAG